MTSSDDNGATMIEHQGWACPRRVCALIQSLAFALVTLAACDRGTSSPASAVPAGPINLTVTRDGLCVAGAPRPRCELAGGEVLPLPASAVEAFVDAAGICVRFADGGVRCGAAVDQLVAIDIKPVRDLSAWGFRACAVGTDDRIRCWDRRPGEASEPIDIPFDTIHRLEEDTRPLGTPRIIEVSRRSIRVVTSEGVLISRALAGASIDHQDRYRVRDDLGEPEWHEGGGRGATMLSVQDEHGSIAGGTPSLASFCSPGKAAGLPGIAAPRAFALAEWTDPPLGCLVDRNGSAHCWRGSEHPDMVKRGHIREIVSLADLTPYRQFDHAVALDGDGARICAAFPDGRVICVTSLDERR